MEKCQFISIEEAPGGDLILSYAVGSLEEIASIILLRAPQFEHLLPDEDKGVHVSDDTHSGATNFLQEFIAENRIVTIAANERSFEIDCSNVDNEEWDASLLFISKMNFDNRYTIRIA